VVCLKIHHLGDISGFQISLPNLLHLELVSGASPELFAHTPKLQHLRLVLDNRVTVESTRAIAALSELQTICITPTSHFNPSCSTVFAELGLSRSICALSFTGTCFAPEDVPLEFRTSDWFPALKLIVVSSSNGELSRKWLDFGLIRGIPVFSNPLSQSKPAFLSKMSPAGIVQQTIKPPFYAGGNFQHFQCEPCCLRAPRTLFEICARCIGNQSLTGLSDCGETELRDPLYAEIQQARLELARPTI
jgi:hypothetical protein